MRYEYRFAFPFFGDPRSAFGQEQALRLKGNFAVVCLRRGRGAEGWEGIHTFGCAKLGPVDFSLETDLTRIP